METWILNNGGNIEQAFRSFSEAAHRDGVVVSFSEFRDRYKIYGAGENIRNSRVENFTSNMTEGGYSRMVAMVEKFLGRQS